MNRLPETLKIDRAKFHELKTILLIDAYRDRNGKEPVLEYLTALCSSRDKDSRIQASKIDAGTRD